MTEEASPAETSTSSTSASASTTVTGNQHHLDATFQTVLDADAVRIGSVVQAKVLASSTLTQDPDERAVGERYYPLLLAAFQQKHKGVDITLQEDVGIGIVLHAGVEGDPLGDKFDFGVIRRTLRFDWSRPRELLIEVQELANEACRWVKNPNERRDLLGVLYGIGTQIGATIGRENRLCPAGQGESHQPSPNIEPDLAIISKQLAGAREQFRGATERFAQFRYVQGMVAGTAAVFGLFGLAAWILAEEHTRIVNVVGFAAGAVGACVSVLERMTRRKLELDALTGDKMILALGALRPIVGGIFGFVVYLVIRAELISIFALPKNTTTALAYVAVFGFVAGFNERFAQDVLANASNARSSED